MSRNRSCGRKIFKIRDMVPKYNGYKSKQERMREQREDKREKYPRRAVRVARTLRVGPIDTLVKVTRQLQLRSKIVMESLRYYRYLQKDMFPTPNAVRQGIAVEFWEIYDKQGNLVCVCKEEPSEMENFVVKLKYLWNVKNVSKVVDAYKKTNAT